MICVGSCVGLCGEMSGRNAATARRGAALAAEVQADTVIVCDARRPVRLYYQMKALLPAARIVARAMTERDRLALVAAGAEVVGASVSAGLSSSKRALH